MAKPLFRSLLSGLMATVTLGLAACPQSSSLSEADSVVQQTSPSGSDLVSEVATTAPAQLAALAAEKQQTESTAAAVAVEVCAELPEWQRSPEMAHIKQLQEMPRYGSALESEPLKGLLEKFWRHEIFSFTTYGLSARTEPVYLSGVWTALDNLWSCYDGNQPEAINQGELAEVWLIHHRAVDLQWAEGQYTLVVEPSDRGLQLIQFSRQEQQPELPLTVVTAAGNSVEAISGDW